VIRFTCKSCGQRIKVNDQYSGKKGKCPKCGGPIVVPAAQQSGGQSSIMKFRCPHCSQKIGLPVEYAGKQVRCAKCKQPFRVPQPSPAAEGSTEILRAGFQQTPESQGPTQSAGSLEELLTAEKNAPPLKFAPPPPPAPVDDEFAGGLDPTRAGLGSYQSSGSEKTGNVNVGLFIGLGCGAAFMVALVMILSFLFGMARNVVQGNIQSPEAEAVCEELINAISKKDFAAAKPLFSENLRSIVKDSELEKLAGRMAVGGSFELECEQTRKLDDPARELLLLSYNLNWADDYAHALILVSQEGDSFLVEQVASMDSSGDTAAVGPDGYQELLGKMFGSAAADMFGGAEFSFPCAALVILAIIGIIQIISVWIIFGKAGQPGWAILIPFYNMWVWALVADKPGWVGLLIYPAGMIPYVGLLAQLAIWIVITIGVAKTFNRGIGFGLGLCFLPMVFYPILAFGND
jgi:predicted RNA-binding Zn-ribbon protein involved in translation (DUF1610 family)